MTTTVIANSFPRDWSYGYHEIGIHDNIRQQMDHRWPDSNNLLFSTTWMGPRTEQCVQDQLALGTKFENLVITSTVDATLNFQVYPLIDRLVEIFDIQKIYRVGNFDGEHEFNFFAIACLDNFCHYEQQDLVLKQLKWRFCCYNRKPYPHRVLMVNELVSQDLESHGVITLGRHFPHTPDHGLYRSIGERDQDYVKWGHWYAQGTQDTPHEIPHDLYSLHNWDVWQHHFLHIVGSTSAFSTAFGLPDPDTFVNQINFKPLIGMRPFVINGQRKQYEYLRRHGFRTFNHYWPQFDLERDPLENHLAVIITNLVKWLIAKSDQEILDMYNDMLPDLIHNRQRWFEWAQEQRHRVNNLLQ
jgi:hypothetical protein